DPGAPDGQHTSQSCAFSLPRDRLSNACEAPWTVGWLKAPPTARPLARPPPDRPTDTQGALMLNVFTLANGRLFQEEIESLEELAQFKPIWVDLEDPTLEERRWVKQRFGL